MCRVPISRRNFIAAASAGLCWSGEVRAGVPAALAPRFRKTSPWEALYPYIEAGHDEFAGEREAEDIAAHLHRLLETRALPLASDFEGRSPLPARYRKTGEVATAEFGAAAQDFQEGLRGWIASLGQVRASRFYVLPENRVRYEIAASREHRLEYRVGVWKQEWKAGRLFRFEPLEETVTRAPRTLFEDVTGAYLGGVDAFEQQLRRGVPSWRARLDSACGIDVYGSNGIAVGDIDGDGRDEIYCCQPAGLPDRLFRNRNGRLEDITEAAGLGILDNTSSALFVDFRNSGRQDLVVLTSGGPRYFCNQGGVFRHKPDAFRFATPPQGSFTGMAAADYDRDGRVDLYLCTYVYFQSEDQYHYPTPYHDARNGPPNYLFHNRLAADGSGEFVDVTAESGMQQNNNRFSFAAAWCDVDGSGWPDLYVANDFGRNNLYRNRNGKFEDAAAAAGVEDLGPGMSAAWLDYDGDGRPDLYVSNMWSAAGQRVMRSPEFQPAAASPQLREAYRRHTKGNSLYRNKGDGTFEETGAVEGVEMGRWAWSSDAFDFDHDGTPEICVAAGMVTNRSRQDLMSFFWRQVVARSPVTEHTAPAYENGWNAINQLIREDYSWNGYEPNVLYARRGGRYHDFSGVSGMDFAEDTRSFAVTDLEGSGSLDLVLKSRLGPQIRVLRNRWGSGRRAIAFELRGVRSNRDAVGAGVEVRHGGRRTLQTVRAGSGFLSQHTKRLHFGLGESMTAEHVTVRWPSGLVQEFADLEAGYLYRITEGVHEPARDPFRPPAADRPAIPVAGDNEPRFEPTWLLEPVPLPERRRGPGFLCLAHTGLPAAPGGVPFEAVDLARANPDVVAAYALFYRYLFDYRSGLKLPLTILVDERGHAHKVYPGVPATEQMRADLALLRAPQRARLALPFAGRYFVPPHRNYFRLGAAFYWAGYPEQALLYFDELLRRNPDNAKARMAVGHIHLTAGRLSEARPHLERAVTLLPNSPEAWTDLAGLEIAAGNYTAALRAAERALARDPDYPYALLAAGQSKARLGDATAAEAWFRRALKADPKSAEAADQLGLALAKQSRFGDARQAFQQALEIDPAYSSAINNLGVLYATMGQFQDAVAAFRYGLKLAPDDEMLSLNLARVFVQSGDRQRARDTLEQFLDRKPDSVTIRKALTQLGGR